MRTPAREHEFSSDLIAGQIEWTTLWTPHGVLIRATGPLYVIQQQPHHWYRVAQQELMAGHRFAARLILKAIRDLRQGLKFFGTF